MLRDIASEAKYRFRGNTRLIGIQHLTLTLNILVKQSTYNDIMN